MFTMKDIVREGHPILRQKAKEVVLPLSPEEDELARELHNYVINSQNAEIVKRYHLRPGIGLAAPQVHVGKRMFALHLPDDEANLSLVAINPKIVSHSVEKAYLSGGEGCLSVDRFVEGYVPRYARITATGFYPDGSSFKLRLKGLAAISFQHELDHLNGIMFYDYINHEDPYAEIPNAIRI